MRRDAVGIILAIFGTSVVLAGVLASFGVGIYYGLTLSTVIHQAIIYALIGFAAVSFELVGYHRTAELYERGRYWAAILCFVGCAAASGINITYDIGFLSTSMEDKRAANNAAISARDSLVAERERLQGEIRNTSGVRGIAAIEADMKAVKLNPRWSTSKQCDDATIDESRELCRRLAVVVTELGSASAIAAAQQRVTAITKELNTMAVPGMADARAAWIANIVNISEERIRLWLGGAIIVFMRLCTVAAPFVMWDRKSSMPPAPTRLERALPPELSPEDAVVADEATTVSEDDIEACLVTMRGRLEAKAVARQPGNAAEAISQVEAFAASALVIDPASSHKIKASELQAAFRHWLHANHRIDGVAGTSFGFAMTAFLEAHGGRKIKRGGAMYYVCVKFSDEFQRLMHHGDGSIISLETRRRLGRGIADLLGEKSQAVDNSTIALENRQR